MCVGVHVDDAYRDAVLDALYTNDQRVVAPSVGFDARRVLVHALRARRIAAAWAALVLAVWLTGCLLTNLLVLALFPGCALLAACGRAARSRRGSGAVLRWAGRITFGLGLYLVAYVALADPAQSTYGSDPYGYGYGYYDDSALLPWDAWDARHGWIALGCLAATACCVLLRQHHLDRVLRRDLAPEVFADPARDPAEHVTSPRLQWIGERIRREQHAPLILYDMADPFCGMGTLQEAWTLTVELRPASGARAPTPFDPGEPFSNGWLIDHIKTQVAALRHPVLRGSSETAGVRLDRLRHMEIDECVFLPVEGLLSRDQTPHGRDVFEEHRRAAVEESGEARRHFLRVRVGAWREEVVTTVFVRAHTQGGIVTLEIVSYVLNPLRTDFHTADRAARLPGPVGLPSRIGRALVRTPAVAGSALADVWRTFAWFLLTAFNGGGRRPPQGPAVSVRELGAERYASMFQELDAGRYIATIRERVVHAVRLALLERDWDTSELDARAAFLRDSGVRAERLRLPDPVPGVSVGHGDLPRRKPA
ncbi:hypothetical protein GCM10010389_64660 [Streptomyces echinoruber]|uniref:Uncharacterized protein n=1 Tax=Streptomyces echinoruber TaxID=68898 RepID=A0A918VRA9_9ACTN|nr:hypothetical protein GCM10010389_64660 [Streptomyces echinoruber]